MLMQKFPFKSVPLRAHIIPRIKFLIPSEKVKTWFSFCLKYFPWYLDWEICRGISECYFCVVETIFLDALLLQRQYSLSSVYIDLYILLCHLTLKMQFNKVLEFVFVHRGMYKNGKNMFLD